MIPYEDSIFDDDSFREEEFIGLPAIEAEDVQLSLAAVAGVVSILALALIGGLLWIATR